MLEELTDIVKEIEVAKAVAESNPRKGINEEGKEVEITNPSVIRQKEGNIRQAKEKLKDLYLKYRKSVMNSSIFIVAVGSTCDKFAEKSSELFGTYSHDAEALYQDLADKIPEKVYMNRIADRQLFDHIGARFEERAMQMDVKAYNAILFDDPKFKKQLKSKQDLVDLMKVAFNKHTGSEVVGLDAIEKTATKAVNENFEGAVVPILLYTKDLAFAQMLAKDLQRLSPNVLLVKSGSFPKGEKIETDLSLSKVTDKGVEEIMVEIKDKVM